MTRIMTNNVCVHHGFFDLFPRLVVWMMKITAFFVFWVRLSDPKDSELINRLAPARSSKKGVGDASIRWESGTSLAMAASNDVSDVIAQPSRFPKSLIILFIKLNTSESLTEQLAGCEVCRNRGWYVFPVLNLTELSPCMMLKNNLG